LAMDREGYESDRLHLEIIHKDTNQIVKITDFLGRYIKEQNIYYKINLLKVIAG
jgi:hypothetical protein